MSIVSNKSKLKSELESLTLHTTDSVKGYEKAADRVEDSDPSVASKWRAIAAARSVHTEKLNDRLACIGEDEKERGSVEGASHRAFISLKDAFTSADVQSVREEAIRGEKKLRGYIEDTFSDLEVIDETTRSAINDLRVHVESSIRELEAATSTA